MTRLAPGVLVPNERLEFSQSRAGGPGGQNVNNTSSKAELRVAEADITGLSWAARQRLRDLAGSRLTTDGVIVLSCDETRSARTNRELVFERLCELAREAQAVPKARKRSRPTRGSIQRRLDEKSHRSDRKRERRDPPPKD
ncbi:MAG: aminoacyl-tRNA hydrolase [Planctomycetes bacterium]|nr:aminoacyl-tRNA hydrolase [Planctomycetota bacterium]